MHVWLGLILRKSWFYSHTCSPGDVSANKMKKSSESLSLSAAVQDIEMPLPPLALAPLQHGIR